MRFLPQWRVGLKSGVLVSLTLFCAAASFAQDLGEIARQERERKKEQPPRATYVYTNDDLERQHILVPEDKARVLAARRSPSTPAVQVAQIPDPAAPVAALPAPVSTPPAPVSAPPAPASDLPVSANAVMVVPTPALVETPPRAVPADLARNQPRAQLSAQSVIRRVPSDALSSAAEKKSGRHVVVTGLASRSHSSRERRDRATRDPEPADSGTADVVTVERGDSLWKLAKRYLGRGARWRELAALNTQILNANVLHAGEWICLPSGNLQTARQTITPRARAPSTIAQTNVLLASPSGVFTAQIASHQP
jgi:nucleoid-associated protein YgaU